MHLMSSTSTTLQTLPSDIKFAILNSTNTFDDLIACAGISKCWSHIYLVSKEVLLLHLTQRRIPYQLLPVALHVARLYQQKDRFSGLPQTLEAINATRGCRTENFTAQGLSLEMLKSLLRFDGLVDRFMHDFIVSGMSIVGQRHLKPWATTFDDWSDVDKVSVRTRPMGIPRPSAALDVPTMVETLSVVEYHRLKRAFYHLELSTFLAAVSAPFSGGPWMPWDQAPPPNLLDPFLRRLRRFEIEEMMCAFQYLYERVVMVIEQVEDDYMQRLGDMIPPHYARCRNNYDYGLSCFFGADGRLLNVQQDWAESSLSRGLVALKSMFTASTPDGRIAAVGTINLDRIWSLSCAVERTAQSQWNSTLDSRALDSTIDHQAIDDIDSPNRYVEQYGHHHLQREATRSISVYEECDGFLRWGCAIWDRDTLESLGIQLSSRLRELYGYDCLCPYRGSSRRGPGLERRIRTLEETWRSQGTLIEWQRDHAWPPSMPPLPHVSDLDDD